MGEGRVLIAVPVRDMMPTASAKSFVAAAKAGFDVVFATGGGLPNARNEILREAKAQQYRAVVMIDSDMVFLPEHVLELVRVAGKQDADILSGRYYSRSAPHQPHAYRGQLPFVGAVRPTRDEVFPVDYTGAGFLYVACRVAEKVTEPWFDHSHRQGEDAYFCKKARLEAAIPTLYYPFVTVGHVGTTMYSDPQYEQVLRR